MHKGRMPLQGLWYMSYSYGQSYGMAQYAVSGNPPTPAISNINCIYLYLFTFTVAKITILPPSRNFFHAISSKRNALTCRSKRTGGKTLVSLLPPSVSGRNGFTLITSLFCLASDLAHFTIFIWPYINRKPGIKLMNMAREQMKEINIATSRTHIMTRKILCDSLSFVGAV